MFHFLLTTKTKFYKLGINSLEVNYNLNDMNNFEFLIFYLFFCLIGRSLSIVFVKNKKVDNLKIFETNLYIFYPIFGVMFLSGIIFISNFLFPLNIFKNYISLALLGLVLYNLKYLYFPQNKLFVSFNYLFVPLIISFSSYNIKFHYDSDAYHLITQSWIINSKIVFGLTKFSIWLGNSSLYEYIQAYLNFRGNYIYQHYLNILFVVFFINFLCFHLYKFKNSYFFNLSFFILIFGILDNFGIGGGSNGFIQIQMVGKPDVGVGVLYLLISIFMIYGIYEKAPNLFELQVLFLLLTFAIQLRIMSAALIFLFVPYVIRNLEIFKKILFSKFGAFIITINSLWLLKNVIISSCLFFPLEFTCFNNLSWNISDELSRVSDYYDGWVYAYKFDRSIFIFLENWIKAGHNFNQVPNLIGSLFALFLIRKICFKKIQNNYKILYLIIPLQIIFAFYYASLLRYWYGLILLIVASLSFNLEIKERFSFIKVALIPFALITILSVGYPRGYSYSYFLNNFDYYALNINYEEYETVENEEGYGVVAKNNKCYDIYYCTTFEYIENRNIDYKEFALNYYIFINK